jgi:chromate transporter
MSSQDHAGTAVAVFRAFLKLGLTSFGGPIAHLGYFRREFVERSHWVTEHQYAELVALCQLLPGPTSSQLGFSLGLLRAGFPGALAAFMAFTLPSALLMLAFATLLPMLSGALGESVLHGLKLVAVAVVAHGVIGMARQLCPDAPRRIIAILATILVLAASTSWMPLLVVALGAAAAFLFPAGVQGPAHIRLRPGYGMWLGGGLLVVFFTLLVVLGFLARQDDVALRAAAAFYRAGALVFGGGHVVLPLLKESLVDTGMIPAGTFLSGYGAAQAVPGPMFTLAAYLGASLPGNSGGVPGAAVAVAMIFLPGLLLISGVLPLWHLIGDKPYAARAIAGINAAVVGLLAAALYNPVWTSSVSSLPDAAIAFLGLLLLLKWRFSALGVVLWCVGASLLASLVMHA